MQTLITLAVKILLSNSCVYYYQVCVHIHIMKAKQLEREREREREEKYIKVVPHTRESSSRMKYCSCMQ